MRDYLEALGGKSHEDGTIHGKEWVASMDKKTIHLTAALSVIEISVTISGSEADSAMDALFQKAQRSGG